MSSDSLIQIPINFLIVDEKTLKDSNLKGLNIVSEGRFHEVLHCITMEVYTDSETDPLDLRLAPAALLFRGLASSDSLYVS